MAEVRVRIKAKGARQLLTSKAVQAYLNEKAERIAAAAGEGFEVRERPERIRRYGVQVRTSSMASREAQAYDNALTRALDAGRG